VIEIAAQQQVPIYVPLLFTACGAAFVVTKGRRMWRDPDGAVREMAEAQAGNPLARALGSSNNPEEEYRKLRGIAPSFFVVVAIGYTIAVGFAWYAALFR
jgi:hypothetical protein